MFQRVFLVRGMVSVLGIAWVAAGAALMLCASLGADPGSVFIQGLQRATRIGFATAAIFFNVGMLALALLIARKYLGLGTIVTGLAIGPLVGLFYGLILKLDLAYGPLWLRATLILLAALFFAVGLAFLICNDFGLSSYDALTMAICRTIRIPFGRGKVAFDALVAGLGIALGGRVGWGTLAIVVVTGPLVRCLLPVCRRLVRILHRMGGPVSQSIGS